MNLNPALSVAVLALSLPTHAADIPGTATTSPEPPGIQSSGRNTGGNGASTSPGQNGSLKAQSTTDEMGRVPSSNGEMRGAGTGTTVAPRTDLPPKEMCEQFVRAASSASTRELQAQLDAWVLRGTPEKNAKPQGHERGGKLSPEKQQWFKKELQNAKCNKETIAGEHAFVVAQSKDRERLLPFAKQSGQWKLDMNAYRAMYRMESGR